MIVRNFRNVHHAMNVITQILRESAARDQAFRAPADMVFVDPSASHDDLANIDETATVYFAARFIMDRAAVLHVERKFADPIEGAAPPAETSVL